MVRIAVLGCGRIGRMHADNIAAHEETTLAMVYDLYGPSAQDVSARHGVPVAESAEAVFAASDVDAVLIATATETHAEYIEMAVAAQKPAICEKPIDLSLDRVRQCARTIAGADVPIQLGFNRRFDPGHRRARDVAHSGRIGDVHQVIITSRDPGMPPRAYYESAGGLFRDMTIHDFDLARFMLGAEPVEVFAVGNGLIDPAMMGELDDIDTAMIIMRTADGTQCHINNSRAAVYGYDQRVEILGTGGMVESGNRRADDVRIYSATEAEIAAPYEFFFIERYNAAFMNELTAFVAAIKNGTTPDASFDDGVKALVLAEAAYLSLSEGRMVRVEEVG